MVCFVYRFWEVVRFWVVLSVSGGSVDLGFVLEFLASGFWFCVLDGIYVCICV